LTENVKFWYRRFRSAAFVSMVVLMVLTLFVVLPFRPFSFIPPIIEAGGPGLWFLLGYVLYAAVGFGGFAALSALMFTIETYESRRPDDALTLAGFALLYAGVTAASALLLLAGALGGYAVNVEGVTTQAAATTLDPFVYPIIMSSLVSIIAAGLLVTAMTRAKMPSN
jgi:hypothetical protein